MSLALIADDLAVRRGGRNVLDGISFRIGAGEAVVVSGPNGAGKTTLLRALAGFLPLTHGSLTLEGGDPDRDLPQQCHYAGHLDVVKPKLTVAENLDFWATYLGGPPQAPVAALERLALGDLSDVSAAYLSAGQKRRLGLARLLVAPRPIWLLDEPTVSLDAESTGTFARIVEQHMAGGGIVLAATHVDLGIRGTRSLRLVAADRASA